jgi:acyl-CoA hydrolase
MDTKQTHGIKIGDLVKFKHHIFEGDRAPVHLVTEVFVRDNPERSVNIRLHGNSGITHRASAFVMVKRA